MARQKGEIIIDVNDLVGMHVGMLEIMSYNNNAYDATAGGLKMRHYYNCKCVCGNMTICQRGALKNDLIHSCGCLKKRKRRK